jgi:hypothetical protein
MVKLYVGFAMECLIYCNESRYEEGGAMVKESALAIVSSGAREPISVAITFDHLRKKGTMMQKVNVSHGKPKMDKMVGRRELPCFRR